MFHIKSLSISNCEQDAITRLDEKMEQYIAEGRENREFIATQVDGIRLETRRIVEHLFGQND